jgi:hypothetical protein
MDDTNETNPRISQAANAWSEHEPLRIALDAISDRDDDIMAEITHFLDWATSVDDRFLPLLQIRATDLLRKVRAM